MAGLEELSREELIALAREQADQLQKQEEHVRQQAGQLERLQAANEDLVRRVERLERQVSRNSENSSMAPSTDDAPGRSQPKARGSGTSKSKRGRGKQPGAEGNALSWVERPDRRVGHRPGGRCGCGAGLDGACDVGVERSHQVHDLPEVRVQVAQHDLYRVRCGCGREHVAQTPPGVSRAPASYGPNVQALVVYLLIYQHLPVERCVALLADLTGGSGPSPGFVHGMLARAANAVASTLDAIKIMITAAAVAGFDETTLRAGPAGTKRHVLSASTERASLFYLGGRDLESFREFDILPNFAGIAVHDRYCNYYHPSWANLAGHQACCAHLLRDFTDAAQCYPSAVWPQQAPRALSGLIHAQHQARDAGQPEIDPTIRDPLIHEFRQAVRVGLSQIPPADGPRRATAQPPGRSLLEFCRDHEHDMLRFCYDTRVWPTNNTSERALRPNKTQQKISGRLTSQDATQDRLDIRGYLDTARKHGENAMTAIRDALTGNPWRPPAAAPT